ncbi:MAG: hypothetical protein HEQ35_21420 [Gloeotrichia echinulata IR180]|jgi:hypothetical protein|nr:hypothetical protein [Gloeotrichia echinulata DEX184]
MSLIEIKFNTDDLSDIYNQLSSETLQRILQPLKQDLIDKNNPIQNNINFIENDENYWAISSERDYVLLPNKNEINNLFKHKEEDKFQSFFEFRGEKSPNFKLIKPAIVSQPSSEAGEWDVKQKGLLEFMDVHEAEDMETASDKIQNGQSHNYVTREEVRALIKEYLSKHFPTLPQTDLKTEIKTSYDKSLSGLFDTNSTAINNIDSNTSLNLGNSESFASSSTNTLEPSILNLLNIYKNDPKSLLENAIEVSETSQSIDNRRLGYNQPVALEKVSRNKGIAWVINIDGSDYLVPKPNLKINEYNYETIESLFICHSYQSGLCNEFTLNIPAKLLAQEKGEKWELSEKGELIFEEN